MALVGFSMQVPSKQAQDITQQLSKTNKESVDFRMASKNGKLKQNT